MNPKAEELLLEILTELAEQIDEAHHPALWKGWIQDMKKKISELAIHL